MSLFDKPKPVRAANPASQQTKLAPLATLAPSPHAERAAAIQRGRPFQPGQSGNPAGRPKGSKNRLSEVLLSAIADDFAEHGASVIAQLREQDIEAYLRLVASLVPRELLVERERQPIVDYAEISFEEAAELVEKERRRITIESLIKSV